MNVRSSVSVRVDFDRGFQLLGKGFGDDGSSLEYVSGIRDVWFYHVSGRGSGKLRQERESDSPDVLRSSGSSKHIPLRLYLLRAMLRKIVLLRPTQERPERLQRRAVDRMRHDVQARARPESTVGDEVPGDDVKNFAW